MGQVSVRSIKLVSREVESRQELDLDFLGTGFRRKIYVATEPGHRWIAPPRRSRTSLTLIPIPVGDGGFGRLLYRDLDGVDREVVMEVGHYYYIPPEVPFQIETAGAGVLEVFAPKTSSGRWFDQDPLPEDFFSRRPAAERAPDAGGAGGEETSP
jgi:hypothetical protein